MKQIDFFDLETQFLFKEVDANYPNYPREQKNAIIKDIIPKLKLAVACIIVDGSKPEYFDFEESKVNDLIDTLKGLDLIIGHNVRDFDYLVLEPYANFGLTKKIDKKTLDTFQILRTKTGSWVGLNELAQLNIGAEKTMNAFDAPLLWRQGQKQKVREYCYNDVKMLRDLYYYAQNNKLKCPLKEFGELKGIVELEDAWR